MILTQMFRIRCLKEIPQSSADVGCLIFLFTFVPVSFIMELCIVMPEFHETGSIMFILTWLGGIFILFNLVGNYLACIMVDSSIRGSILFHALSISIGTSVVSIILKPPLEAQLRKYWHLCVVCEVLVPPRSWHCATCHTCILKRDHHCIFTANCVGHRNQRYFFMFLLHSLIGCSYAFVYNNIYFWWLHKDVYQNLQTALKLICPFIGFITELSSTNVYLFIYETNMALLIYIVVLLSFHLPNILRGATTYERQSPHYDFGFKKNLEIIFGKRWHLVWLSPFINSTLPHDGINWDLLLKQTSKNR